MDSAPLRSLIADYIDHPMLDQIAERHRAGARLLVVTTNIDAERNIVWNMGAIAAFGHPEARQVFIAEYIASDLQTPFDPDYMRAAYALGHRAARKRSWETALPLGIDLLSASDAN